MEREAPHGPGDGSGDVPVGNRRRGVSRPLTAAAPVPAKHDGPTHIGRFMILDRIGGGAMGELFLGWDRQLSRKLAIKLVRARGGKLVRARGGGAANDERLADEARALAQISHPNVVQVFEVGVHDGRVFVAMEFVEGETLRDWQAGLKLHGAARVAEVLPRFVAAGRGLEAVHAAGLVHHDFKPSNVVVGGDGRVRVVDFGLAGELEADASERDADLRSGIDAIAKHTRNSDATLTDTELLRGTPRYMAPEQWLGRRGDDRSDQFSFCVALFEALYEGHPFAGDDTSVGGRLRDPPAAAEVPVHVRAALERGLSSDPAARFPSMAELLAELEPEPPQPESASKPVMRWRWRVWVGLGVALGLVLVSLGAWMLTPVFGARGSATSSGRELSWRVEVSAAIRLAQVERDIAAMLAAGQVSEADASFAAYAELPAHAGTLALARGWLHQAERLAARGELEAELDAYAAAYLSDAVGTQQRALFGLAREFVRTRQWTRLGPTLDAIEDSSATLEDALALELRAMRVAELSSRRDLAAAAELATAMPPATSTGSPAVSPLLRDALVELARVTTTKHELFAHNLRGLRTIDVDGDGVGELAIYAPGSSSVTLLDGDSPTLEPLTEIELGRPITGLHGLGEGLFGVSHGRELVLHRLVRDPDAGLTLTQLWTGEQPSDFTTNWTRGDVDRDGWSEVYIGLQAGRRLLGVEEGPLGWQGGAPHPPTDASNSVINDVLARDIDGDGDDELAVLAGEWMAYDLRVLGLKQDTDPANSDGASVPALELLARRKLGTVTNVAALPAPDGRGHWLAVTVSEGYPSRRVWPAERPHGVAGVYVFAWDGRALQEVAFVALPWPQELFAGDFDGNGISDLAVGSSVGDGHLDLLLQGEPGKFELLEITGLRAVDVLDHDRDGDDELLVVTTEDGPSSEGWDQHGRLHVLGTGGDRLPVIAASTSPATPTDTIAAAGDDEIVRASIARAEQLATIGLPLRAAGELRKLARVAKPELAGMLRLRAAELFERRGHRIVAADTYAEAARDPALLGAAAMRARTRAMQLYAELHRFAAAADMAAAALELGDADTRPALQAELERLRALTIDEPKLAFEFDDALDERWSVDPLLVRHRKGRLAVAIAGGGDRVVARREVQWDGGRLALELELEIDSVEWSSEIRVALVPLDVPAAADGPGPTGPAPMPMQVGVRASGGGGIYGLDVRCVSLGYPEPPTRGYPISLPEAKLRDDARRMVLRVELVGERRWCTAEGPSVHAETGLEGGLAPGRYELVIGGHMNHPWDNEWALATASIERIELIGVRDPPTLARELDELDTVRRELAELDPEQALARLDALDGAAHDVRELAWLRFIALDELGRTEASERALFDALALDRDRPDCRSDARTHAWIALLLRTQLERLGPTLHRACGDADYFSILSTVWEGTAYQHPEAESLERMLGNHTEGLERWSPASVAQRRAFMLLACERARVRSDASVTGPVLAELRRAVELGDAWQRGSEHPLELADVLARCRTSLAAELLDLGDESLALTELGEALANSPTPEILADILAIDPRFASIHARPQWQALIEPARGR